MSIKLTGKNNKHIKESINKELELYVRDIWSFLPIPIFYVNPVGIIMDVSKKAVEFLSIKEKKIIRF